MNATVACLHCQSGRATTHPGEELSPAPVCLVCEMRRTQQGLAQELSATWQALNAQSFR